MAYSLDNAEDTLLIFAFAVILGFFIVLAFYYSVVIPFMRERDYIKMEINRCNGEEYYFWKKELRKLYLTHIPVIGRFFR